MRSNVIHKDNNLYEYCIRHKHYNLHLQRVNEIYQRPINSKRSYFMLNDHLIDAANYKKEIRTKFTQQVEQTKVQKENDILLQKLIDISSKPSSLSPIRDCQTSVDHDRKERQERSFRKRVFKDYEIQEQNEKINNRLISQQSTLQTSVFKQDYKKKQEYKMRIVRYQTDERSQQVYLKAMNFHYNYIDELDNRFGINKYYLSNRSSSENQATNISQEQNVNKSIQRPKLPSRVEQTSTENLDKKDVQFSFSKDQQIEDKNQKLKCGNSTNQSIPITKITANNIINKMNSKTQSPTSPTSHLKSDDGSPRRISYPRNSQGTPDDELRSFQPGSSNQFSEQNNQNY